MNGLRATLSSSVGKKLIMALTGLFLCLFLVIHLIGNLQLLKADSGEAFNRYAQFMGHNPLIQFISIGNFVFILLHIIFSLVLTRINKNARPISYAANKPSANSLWSSRNMGILGTIILIFLVVHLQNFWYHMKFGVTPMVTYGTETFKDLYAMTREAFSQGWLVVLYVVSMAGLAFHLSHGFQSAFQTIGFNHKKYKATINTIGIAFCILISAAFAFIPVYIFFMQQ